MDKHKLNWLFNVADTKLTKLSDLLENSYQNSKKSSWEISNLFDGHVNYEIDTDILIQPPAKKLKTSSPRRRNQSQGSESSSINLLPVQITTQKPPSPPAPSVKKIQPIYSTKPQKSFVKYGKHHLPVLIRKSGPIKIVKLNPNAPSENNPPAKTQNAGRKVIQLNTANKLQPTILEDKTTLHKTFFVGQQGNLSENQLLNEKIAMIYLFDGGLESPTLKNPLYLNRFKEIYEMVNEALEASVCLTRPRCLILSKQIKLTMTTVWKWWYKQKEEFKTKKQNELEARWNSHDSKKSKDKNSTRKNELSRLAQMSPELNRILLEKFEKKNWVSYVEAANIAREYVGLGYITIPSVRRWFQEQREQNEEESHYPLTRENYEDKLLAEKKWEEKREMNDEKIGSDESCLDTYRILCPGKCCLLKKDECCHKESQLENDFKVVLSDNINDVEMIQNSDKNIVNI